jgi:hypothetical protein
VEDETKEIIRKAAQAVGSLSDAGMQVSVFFKIK